MEKITRIAVLCILFALFVFSQDIPSPNTLTGEPTISNDTKSPVDWQPSDANPTNTPEPLTSDNSDNPSGLPPGNPEPETSDVEPNFGNPSGPPPGNPEPETSDVEPIFGNPSGQPQNPQPQTSDVKPVSDKPSGPSLFPPQNPTMGPGDQKPPAPQSVPPSDKKPAPQSTSTGGPTSDQKPPAPQTNNPTSQNLPPNTMGPGDQKPPAPQSVPPSDKKPAPQSTSTVGPTSDQKPPAPQTDNTPTQKQPYPNNLGPNDQKPPAPQANYPPSDKKPAPQSSTTVGPTSDQKPPAPQTNNPPTQKQPNPNNLGPNDQRLPPAPQANNPPSDKKPAPQSSTISPTGDKKPAPQSSTMNPTGDNKPAPQSSTISPTGDKKPAPQSSTISPTGDKKPAPQTNTNGPSGGSDKKPAPQTNTPSGGSDKRPAPQSIPSGGDRPAPAVIVIKNCDGACPGERPCSNAICKQDPFSLSCNWLTSLCVVPVISVNTTVNCSTNGACGTNVPSCKEGKPICSQTGQTCNFICQSSGDNGGGTQIDCTGRCSGTPLCSSSDAKCGLVTVQSSSSSSVAAQCQWICPDPCASWCSGSNCPSGFTQIACGSQGSSSCLRYCASSECSSSPNCLASTCPPGTYGICKGPRANCSLTCVSLACDACNPNCVPICALGSSAPCVNSRCAVGANTDSSGSGSLVSKCAWIPNLSSTECLSQPIKTCSGKPQCAVSTCATDANGNLYWDNSNCKKDCGSVPQALCPGGSVNCTSGPGYCYLSGSNCVWTCPIDPCTNSTSGDPLCSLPAPEGPPFTGCVNWKRRCVARDSSVTSTACDWKVDCFQVVNNTGICGSGDCGTKPNTSCPGKEKWSCNRPDNGGACQWLYICPPDPTLTTPCSASDCPVVNTVDDGSSSGVCGINPEAQPVCVRNSKGVCDKLTPCVPVFSLPSCQLSPCGDVCYDPRWKTLEINPPESFDASSNFTLNCTICERRCSTLLICNRPSSNPICQLTSTERYDKCIAKCNYVPVVVPPVSPNDTTTPTAPTVSPTTPTTTTGPYRGQNPCLCDYTISVFVTAIYPQKSIMVASCVSKDTASNSADLRGNPVIYASNSKPSYCQVQDDTTTSPTSTTPVATPTASSTSVVDVISNLDPDDIQESILDKLSGEDSSDFVDYLPQISAVLVPSQSTSTNSSDEDRVNVGVIITLTGTTQPSDETVKKWCFFVLGHVVESFKITIEVCTVQLQSQSRKRDILDTTSSNTYALTSDISSTPVVDNSPAPDMTPVGTPGATPVGTPGATPVGTPGATPVETPGATPVETPTSPVVTPAPASKTPTSSSIPGSMKTPAPASINTPAPASSKTPSPPHGPSTNSSSKLIWSFLLVVIVVLVVF